MVVKGVTMHSYECRLGCYFIMPGREAPDDVRATVEKQTTI
jgi:hypothetical protein